MKRRIVSYEFDESMDVQCIEYKEDCTELVRLAQEISSGTDDVHTTVQLVERNKFPCGTELIARTSGGPSTSGQLVQLAQEIAQADAVVATKMKAKLSIISEQMEFLRRQALASLSEAREASRLNHVACNFRKVPGTVYHVYRRPSGQEYLSVLSPSDWNQRPPHEYLSSYKFEKDMSWTRI